jgi:hypothetical protein
MWTFSSSSRGFDPLEDTRVQTHSVSSSSIRQGIQLHASSRGIQPPCDTIIIIASHRLQSYGRVLKGYNHKRRWPTTHNIPTAWAITTRDDGLQHIISQSHGLQPKGRWAPTQYSYIPITRTTTQGSLGTNPVQLYPQPHGLQPKGRWEPTQYNYIPITWATTQGSLGTDLVQLYPNHMGYNPRVVGHRPSTTISQPHGLQPKGHWAPTQYNYIPPTWATTQGSLGTNLVQLYPNHMGYNPRVVGHQPSTTYQSIDKCHTQLSPSRSIITGQPNSFH